MHWLIRSLGDGGIDQRHFAVAFGLAESQQNSAAVVFGSAMSEASRDSVLVIQQDCLRADEAA